ncbi:MAG TPA: ABC transporter permease [Candidatus Angelobacter sp.]
MGELFRRLRYLLFHRRFDRDLENEMEFHREMAAQQGRRNFGNTLRLREQSREAWGWTWIDRLLQDLRYAARILWRSPGFTLTAVVVLTLGIGVCVTAFSLLNVVALKLLPVRDPASLVRLQRRSPEIITAETPYTSMLFYRDHTKTLSAVMATMGASMEFEEDTKPVSATFVTANYFAELGSPIATGRLFDPARDGAANAPPVVVLRHHFWQQRFGGDPLIVGKIVTLNKEPATVIGVLANTFVSPQGGNSEVYLPLTQQPYFVEGSTALTDVSGGGGVRMWGRLAPGITAKMAEQELLTLTNELRKQHPKLIWDKEYIRSDPGGYLAVIDPDMYHVFFIVGVLVALIFVVACANLGGLMMARGVTREHEIGIRIAIGASRKRIFRQLFTESLLLALVGAFSGLALSYVCLRIVAAWSDGPTNDGQWISFAPDWRVFLFVMGIAIAAAILFGLAPALQVARQRQRRTIVRKILVGAQIAASCVLLIVSGLLVHAVHHLMYSDPGFGYEQVIGISPGLDSHGYTPEKARAYVDEFKGRLLGLPGVTSVAMSKISLLGNGFTAYMTVDVGGHPVNIYPNWVDPEFFKTMEIPLLRGRNLLPGETHAVIVSESLARKQWPGQEPLGQKFGDQKDLVVGVVGNARIKALNDGDAVEAYWAAQLADMPSMTLLVKTAGSPDNLPPMVKSAAEGLDPKLFPYIWLLKSGFRDYTQILRNTVIGASLLGMMAALIAGVGILGLVAYAVSQRTKEIAIRIALGAKPLHVLSVVLRQFLWPVLVGAVVGAAGTAAVSQVLRKALYGISNLDPAGYAGGIVVLIGIAACAALLPARRALRVDPVRALHEQ